MKKLFLGIFVSILFSCKQNKENFIKPELIVELEIQQEFNHVFVLNQLKNAVKYDLDYGDGTKITGDTTLSKSTIGINGGAKYYYSKDGSYTIVLTAYDVEGESKSVSKTITVDYVNKHTASADFLLEWLNDGVIKMKNLSENYSSVEIGIVAGNVGFNTKAESPTFEPDMNGKYIFELMANAEYSDSKTKEINIQHIVDREKGYFKGEWFGKEMNVSESFGRQSFTEYLDIAGNNSYLLLKNTFPIDEKQGIILINNKVKSDSLKTNQMKYEQIKSKFKTGIQNSDNWSMDALGNPISKTIEITEIREVIQRQLIPEMDTRAFWISYTIKADFGVRGKIDGILKIRYLVY